MMQDNVAHVCSEEELAQFVAAVRHKVEQSIEFKIRTRWSRGDGERQSVWTGVPLLRRTGIRVRWEQAGEHLYQFPYRGMNYHTLEIVDERDVMLGRVDIDGPEGNDEPVRPQFEWFNIDSWEARLDSDEGISTLQHELRYHMGVTPDSRIAKKKMFTYLSKWIDGAAFLEQAAFAKGPVRELGEMLLQGVRDIDTIEKHGIPAQRLEGDLYGEHTPNDKYGARLHSAVEKYRKETTHGETRVSARQRPKPTGKGTCYICGNPGHLRRDCPQRLSGRTDFQSRGAGGPVGKKDN